MKATVDIQTATRSNITYLERCYFTTPFKVANITENKKLLRLHLMLMSASPGILDGDQYRVNITLKEGSSLKLQTQSYQRLFNMKSTASQAIEVNLDSDTSFCFLPHPVVPHAASDFRCTNKFFVGENCCLVFGEVLTCGRKLNGEVFRFSRYHNITEVFLQNKLMIKENLLIVPAETETDAIGQLEGFTHQASFIYLHARAVMNDLVASVHSFLSAQPGILFGVTAAPCNGLIVRILGNKAEQLHTCLQSIALLLPQQIQLKPTIYAN